jgi:hypothetical protein
MDTLIKSYQPIRSEDELYLWIGAVVALLAFGAMGFVIRKEFSYEEQSKKWLIALLLFIVGLIASGTAVFSWLSQQRIGKVAIYTDHLILGKTEIPFGQIKRINIEREEEKSFVNPNIVQKKYDLLFIENLEGEVFVVSGQAYPVREMLQGVRQAIDKWKNRSDSETLE